MKKISATLCMVSMLFSTVCMGADLRGSVVPPFPDGMNDEGGACIARSFGPERLCDYSIGLLQTPDGRIFYLGKSAPRVEPSKVRWLVTDQMEFPRTQQGEQVLFGLCERNGVFDETIIAVIATSDAKWHTGVRIAYQANLKTERFETISPTGIRCVNEGWGV